MKVLHYKTLSNIHLPLTEKVENIVVQVEQQKNVVTLYKTLHAQMVQMNPDVVHIYGSWDWRLGIIAYLVHRMNKVLIYSPMRGITPSIIEKSPIKKKFWELVTYQYWLIHKSDVVIMQDYYEEGMLETSGMKCRNVEILPVHDELSVETHQDYMYFIYRKAVDTNYRRFITSQEKQFVVAMVQLAMLDAVSQIQPPYVNNLSMRRIALYAHDEDARDLIIHGAEKASVTLPEMPEITDDMRYPMKGAKMMGGFADKDVVSMIKTAHKIKLKNLTLRHWAELYHQFRNVDFNEDEAVKEIKKFSLVKTTKKIEDRLTELFFLKPGYKIL